MAMKKAKYRMWRARVRFNRAALWWLEAIAENAGADDLAAFFWYHRQECGLGGYPYI